MVSVAILCGGKSSRFGEDKLYYRINGLPLFKIVYEKFKDLTDDIFLQGAMVKENGGLLCYRDRVEDRGPLGGIYSALMNAKHDLVFVMAADMPDVDPRIFLEMKKYDNYYVVVPVWNSRYHEPLCAIYSKDMMPIIKTMLDKGILKVSRLYESVLHVRHLDIADLIEKGKIDKNCFANLNEIKQ